MWVSNIFNVQKACSEIKPPKIIKKTENRSSTEIKFEGKLLRTTIKRSHPFSGTNP